MISAGRVCVVQLGQLTVGIAGAYTRQVQSLTDLRRAPRTPAALLGLFAVRSQVIPIVALEPLLGLPVPKHEFAVQLEFESRQFGIGIDAALGFVPFQASTTAAEASLLDSLCEGAMRYQNNVIPMLSLPKVLEALSGAFVSLPNRVVFTAPATIARVLS